MLLELLAGKQIFRHDMTKADLMSAKRSLPQQLRSLLPGKLADGGKLIHLLGKLIAPHPEDRFVSADDADLNPECGAPPS